MATAFLASCWPTMNLSSWLTTSRGVIVSWMVSSFALSVYARPQDKVMTRRSMLFATALTDSESLSSEDFACAVEEKLRNPAVCARTLNRYAAGEVLAREDAAYTRLIAPRNRNMIEGRSVGKQNSEVFVDGGRLARSSAYRVDSLVFPVSTEAMRMTMKSNVVAGWTRTGPSPWSSLGPTHATN